MSLVGTRPPTVDEWEKYELHHRSRMSTKPGITGMRFELERGNVDAFAKLLSEHWELSKKLDKGSTNTCITTFLCSVQHSPDVEVSDFRHIIESMMVLAACEYGLDGDFQKLVNPTGRFVLGGSFADCGVTGRKLACDTYGGIGRIGGGALSGKDPTKVDRSAAYMARKIAKDIVQAGYADKCEVQLAYAIGVVQPVGVAVECFGTEHQSLDFIEAYVRDSYDLTPQGIIQRLGLLDVDYNKVSAYGHFGKAGLPWEE